MLDISYYLINGMISYPGQKILSIVILDIKWDFVTEEVSTEVVTAEDFMDTHTDGDVLHSMEDALHFMEDVDHYMVDGVVVVN